MDRRAPDRESGRSSAPVVIIGGTGGIGAAIAERFSARDADVWLAGLRAEQAPSSLRGRTTELDVTRSDELESFLRGFDELGALVNAAGIIRREGEYEPEVFAEVLAVNLGATMRSCVAAKAALAASCGCVVNIASMLSFAGGPLVPAYSASKGGVVQLTKSLAVAWAQKGIRVNAVAPGWISTELTSALRTDARANARIVDRTPMGRWGEPAEVAGAVEFLCGPDAGFVTGVVLPVDGGYLAA